MSKRTPFLPKAIVGWWMVPLSEKGYRCKSGDMKKVFPLGYEYSFGWVDMSLEDTSDLEMSSHKKDVWWSSHDDLEPNLIPWRRTDNY